MCANGQGSRQGYFRCFRGKRDRGASSLGPSLRAPTNRVWLFQDNGYNFIAEVVLGFSLFYRGSWRSQNFGTPANIFQLDPIRHLATHQPTVITTVTVPGIQRALSLRGSQRRQERGKGRQSPLVRHRPSLPQGTHTFPLQSEFCHRHPKVPSGWEWPKRARWHQAQSRKWPTVGGCWLTSPITLPNSQKSCSF